MSERILVTGATGFVGKNFIRSINKFGFKVDLVVRENCGVDFSKIDSVCEIIQTPDLFSHNSDWWENICKKYSTVVHLAWYVEPGSYINSDKNIDCLIGTLALIRGARRAGVKKFVGVGTCLEYDINNQNLSAELSSLKPKSLYGACKLAVYNTLLQVFNEPENNFLWFRLFYLLPNKTDKILYGDNLRLGDYIKSRIFQNMPVHLTNGTQIRDYLFVEEATNMMAEAIFEKKIGAMNICSGIPRTVRDVAEEIAFELGKPDLLRFGSKTSQANDPEYIVGIKDSFFIRDEKSPPRVAVTICIPVRNAESFIYQAIESCLSQTFKNYEILIVDNASTDGTLNIVKKFSSERIKIIKNKNNIGITANFNACIENAKGEYLKFLCADDILSPDCLEKMFLAFEKYPDAKLVMSRRNVVDQKGDVIGCEKFPSLIDEIDGHKAINKCLFGSNFIGEPTAVMFRKSDAKRGFCEKYKHLLDLEMWFYLLEKGSLINIKEVLCSVRRHDQQMTLTSIKSGALLNDNKFLYQDYINKSYIKKSFFNILKWKLFYLYRFVKYK